MDDTVKGFHSLAMDALSQCQRLRDYRCANNQPSVLDGRLLYLGRVVQLVLEKIVFFLVLLCHSGFPGLFFGRAFAVAAALLQPFLERARRRSSVVGLRGKAEGPGQFCLLRSWWRRW